MDNIITPDKLVVEFKDKHFLKQKERVYSSLYNKPQTMLMVAVQTDILRANICRYIANFKKDGCVKIKCKGICKISKYPANYYTTKID